VGARSEEEVRRRLAGQRAFLGKGRGGRQKRRVKIANAGRLVRAALLPCRPRCAGHPRVAAGWRSSGRGAGRLCRLGTLHRCAVHGGEGRDEPIILETNIAAITGARLAVALQSRRDDWAGWRSPAAGGYFSRIPIVRIPGLRTGAAYANHWS